MTEADASAQGAAAGRTQLAVACLDSLRARGHTVATAESLTAGLVSATLATVPGASECLRGGLVAYATDVKVSVLGVDGELIAQHGVVSAECAEAMARRAQALFGSDWALSTTGVAGPTEQDGRPVGTVYVSVAGPDDSAVRALELVGGRDKVRRGAVDAALGLLLELLIDAPHPASHGTRDLPVDPG